MEQLLQDARYGLRSLTSKPGFSLVAILTLTLGVGVNTMMFSLSMLGIAAGVVASSWLSRFIDTLLFGVSAVDVPSFAAMGLAVAALSGLAGYLPARRATRIQPIHVLKAE